MERRSGVLWRVTVLALSILAVGVLLLAPQTSWIVQTQGRLLVGKGFPLWGRAPEPETTALAGTYAKELVGALSYRTWDASDTGDAADDARIEQLRLLLPRYNNRPALYAHLLRYLMLHRVQIRRPDPDELNPKPIQPYPTQQAFPYSTNQQEATIAPADITLFEETTAHGMVLDPKNAYFPLLRAAACYAIKQDSEAARWLERAALCSYYDDYITDELQARVVLARANYGEIGAISRVALEYCLRFPHLAAIRLTAQVATVQAVHRELQGQKEEGFRLRRNLSRVGATIRVSAPSMASAATGVAIISISTSRPGGTPVPSEVFAGRPPSGEVVSTIEPELQRSAQYVNYLKRIGYPEEAIWFEQESARGREAVAIHERGRNLYYDAVVGLLPVWTIAQFLICGIFWTLVCGGISTLIVRKKRGERNTDLSAETRWGLTSGIVIPVSVALSLLLDQLYFADTESAIRFTFALIYWFGMGLVILAPFIFLKRGKEWRHYGISLLRFFAAFLGLDILAGLVVISFAWAEAAGLCPIEWFVGSWDLLVNGLCGGVPLSITSIFCGLLLLIPCLVILGFAVHSRLRRESIALGVARGFSNCTPWLTAILLVGYALITLQIAQEETRLRSQAEAQLQHAGKFEASLLGRTWPGPAEN